MTFSEWLQDDVHFWGSVLVWTIFCLVFLWYFFTHPRT